MDPTDFYLAAIRALDSSFRWERVELNTTGQFNDVLVIDQRWVFRFPRYAEGARALAAEARLLQALGGRLPLPSPAPVYLRLVEEPNAGSYRPGQCLMGYRMLPGEPLYPARLKQVRDPADRQRLAEQLAEFLLALHSLPADELGIALAEADRVDDWQRFSEEVQDLLFPAMRPEARRRVTRQFQRYFQTVETFAFTPTVRHGDFGGSNLLVHIPQPKRNQVVIGGRTEITGVLDFSACALGDPAMDLASASTLGRSFFGLLARHYEPDDELRQPLLARASFYRGTFALMEALDGAKNGDQQAFLRGMEGYL